MKLRPALLLLACAMLSSALAGAQTSQADPGPNWPTRPIRMLVGSPPGGGTDAMARAVADKLALALKKPVVVENRPGASNTLAADVTAKSTDGHTMVMGVATAHAIVPHLMKLGYDNSNDLVPVVYVGAVPNVLVVNNNLGVNDVNELVALAKRKPGELNFASSGIGSVQHIAGEMFKDATGTSIAHVPYKGSGPALVDLVAGQVQMNLDTMPSVLQQIQAGKIKALGVASAQRSPRLPNVPTLAESGLAGVEMKTWYGIYMPAATPRHVQQIVHDELNKILAQPDTKTRIENFGGEVAPMSQAEFAAFHAKENARYADLIKRRGIRGD